MLEVRAKQLQNQARRDFSYNESLNARLIPFLRKEATEKEAAEKEEEDNEEDQLAWPLGSSNDEKEAAEKEVQEGGGRRRGGRPVGLTIEK
jgi:hypothetical protein